jgi:hypothetical protein
VLFEQLHDFRGDLPRDDTLALRLFPLDRHFAHRTRYRREKTPPRRATAPGLVPGSLSRVVARQADAVAGPRQGHKPSPARCRGRLFARGPDRGGVFTTRPIVTRYASLLAGRERRVSTPAKDDRLSLVVAG